MILHYYLQIMILHYYLQITIPHYYLQIMILHYYLQIMILHYHLFVSFKIFYKIFYFRFFRLVLHLRVSAQNCCQVGSPQRRQRSSHQHVLFLRPHSTLHRAIGRHKLRSVTKCQGCSSLDENPWELVLFLAGQATWGLP